MAKDYFQDILPPQTPSTSPSTRKTEGFSEEHTNDTTVASQNEPGGFEDAPAPSGRSIRNISVSPRPPRRLLGSEREIPGVPPRPPRRFFSPRIWMWIIAVLAILVLGTILLVALRPTTVNVVPRSHAVVFDSFLQFNAYPATEASVGSLPYSVETVTLEDSAVVPSNGTEYVETKASGTIIVSNNYSSESVRLIPNTRFETPDGLIFRTSSQVFVPGKKGGKPGEVQIKVVADKAGEAYNIGPISRFTLPGLITTPAMHADVYARSTDTMTGGALGDRPAVTPGTLESARAEIRARLETQARAAVDLRTNEQTVALADLMRITYTTQPNTEEAGGNVRIREIARVEIPVFPASSFAQTVSRSVSADAEDGAVMLNGASALTARLMATDTDFVLGTDPFGFTLSGMAQLVWKVDSEALTSALAGRNESAFQTIVATFPGIEEASARIQPFWKKAFPVDPTEIHTRIEEPVLPGA